MLKWKTLHETDFSREQDFLETILIESGVEKEQIPEFLNPSRKNVHDPFLLKNMDRAVEMIHKHIVDNDKMLILFDVDVDGISSGSIVKNFVKKFYTGPNSYNIVCNINGGKKHGLTIDYIEKDMKLVIVPDASSEDMDDIREWFPELDIVFLDHHEVDVDKFNDEHTVMVNCQDGQYPNKTLCGAGVVQKFIEAYASTYPDEVPDGIRYEFLDLVSLGLIADAMDLRNLESRWYALQGLEEVNYNNKGLNALCDHLTEIDRLPYGRYITSVGWAIAPLINSCIRVGERKEVLELIESFTESEEAKEYQPRRKKASDPKPEPVSMSMQEWVAHNLINIKNRQDNRVRKAVKELENKIEKEGLDRNSFIIVDGSVILKNDGTFTGLIANKLASQYMRPALVLRRYGMNKDVFGGSMRAYSEGNIDDLKGYLNGIGVVASGHASAAGLRFDANELDRIIEQSNKDFPLDSLERILTVDWEIPADKLKASFISEVAEAYSVFGNGVPAPKFMISGLRIKANQIQSYADGKFIRFTHGNCTFTKKYCKHGEYDEMTHLDRRSIGAPKYDLEMNLLCEFCFDKGTDGKTYAIAKIVEFDSEIVKESSAAASVNNNIDLEDFDW